MAWPPDVTSLITPPRTESPFERRLELDPPKAVCLAARKQRSGRLGRSNLSRSGTARRGKLGRPEGRIDATRHRWVAGGAHRLMGRGPARGPAGQLRRGPGSRSPHLHPALLQPDLVAAGAHPAFLGCRRPRPRGGFARDRRAGASRFAISDPASQPRRGRDGRAVFVHGRNGARESGGGPRPGHSRRRCRAAGFCHRALPNRGRLLAGGVEPRPSPWRRDLAVRARRGVPVRERRKLGRLAAAAPDVCREVEFSPDYSEWSFLPSYNAHFFRRVHTIDDFLVVEGSLVPRAAVEGTTTTSPGTAFKLEEGSSLPDGIVTFLMTDVVESTPMWIQSRASMYQAMRRHDQLLTAAIEAYGGIVLKERGAGDSFFAVFPRATDALLAAVEAQQAVQSEPWPDRLSLAVRVAVVTGGADALDRDYRSPAVNRCAKLRRRAVGNQILVSETTYTIVADILRSDIQLVSVGKRRLEGHDRPEEVYVVQHSEVTLGAAVAEDEVLA